jgi:TonB-linked SusC/RagA family outer membrane protein
MTNYKQYVRILIILVVGIFCSVSNTFAQESQVSLSGKILESGTGKPIEWCVVSVSSNSESTITDSAGQFNINLPTLSEKIMVSYPGYFSTEVYISSAAELVVYLTQITIKSEDEEYSSLLGAEKVRNSSNAVTLASGSVFDNTAASSFEQTLNGKVPGLHIIEHSGMPGHNSWINLRGISSIFGRNEPLVFIDGMIHEIDYSKNQIIEGHLLNPLDLVDVDDLVDISVIKAGEGYLGSAGSNGVLNINTEQNKVTSSSIIFKMYGGISFPNLNQEVMNAEQFEPYFNELYYSDPQNTMDINTKYPWLNGTPASSNEYYRFNNNTDWQKEIGSPAGLQKYYIFIKGGDDIATYNISSGYTRHGGAYDNWNASKYNLRLNGIVNITNKLSVVPNIKLALSQNKLSNMGPTYERNPVTSSLLKPAFMAANSRSPYDGTTLVPYDDAGDPSDPFGVSNPAVLIDKALGQTRDFQTVASLKIGYDITANLSIDNLTGVSVNNDRQTIFIPDRGVMMLHTGIPNIDSAYNNSMDMTTESRSFQNHTTITYKETFNQNHNVRIIGGMRIMKNQYKNSIGISLNSPSDEFSGLGESDEYAYLQSGSGELSELNWISYFGDFNYNFQEKYYVRVSMSYDGSSSFNDDNRYNFYPSVFGAWRVSSEEFMKNVSWINDLKVRGSYSQTGNMFSKAYVMSKNTYRTYRYDQVGTPIKDYITNNDLSNERKSTINAGIDISVGKKAFNFQIDYHHSVVNNLIINQTLPYQYGFTDYLDNGGAMTISGLELGANGRFYFGKAILMLDAAITYQGSKIKSFDFIDSNTEFLTRQVVGAEYIASVDNPVNAFYGYKTNGVYNTDAEANGIIGPNGVAMGAGDVIFMDMDGNNIINEKDKQIIGNPNPDLFGSFTAALGLKRFEISALFNYSIGNDMFNYVRSKTTGMDSYASQSIDVLDRWTASTPDAELPKATLGDPHGNNVFSDRWIEDASFLRIKQLMVSYTTPNIGSFNKETKFYITGTNLFTFTKYSGNDPETMYQSNSYYMGIDYGKLPLAPTVIVGIQLSL